ncbi:MAG: type IV secretion system DNA-binding domain-containing protein, partial [Parasporobacterium sp.]|nr:type IV secretion system DNA-binding domain-containing protein [Parasporobacterium sp.]
DVAAAVIRQGLAAMFATKKGETATVQIALGKGFAPSAVPDKLQDPHESWLTLALSGVKKASAESVKSAKEKAGQFNYQTIIRIGASGKNAIGRIDNIISAFRTLQSSGVNLRALPDTPEHLHNVYIPWTINLRLSVKEITPFLLLPAGEEEFPGVAKIHPKRLPPPKWYTEPEKAPNDRTFAVSVEAVPKRLSISPKDSLEHTILIGPTGSGKSTAMEHLILSDINAGRSVLVLDPKADLVTDILERIPPNRHQDTIVIDPSDAAPVGFNPLHFKGFKNKELVADTVLSVFHEIFEDSWGIRTQQILSAALLTLCDIPESTLLWLPTLLTNAEFRSQIVSRVKDRIGLLPFWRQFDAMKESERTTHIGPVLNKMEQFIFRPGLRAVLGQSKPKFNLMDIFYERKIVLVPLNRGLVGGESAKLLGSLIVGLAWTLALSRAKIPAEKRHIVSFYIDELQDYLRLPTDLADALAQARGLGVGMTLAHQYRGQLPPAIRSAIDANTRNKIVFGLNGNDAREMAYMSPELSSEDYMLLPRFHIYTNIMQNRRSSGWMMGRTLPPSEPINLAAELKALSMKNYGRDAKQTDDEFLRLVYPESEDDITNIADDTNDKGPKDQEIIGRKRSE